MRFYDCDTGTVLALYSQAKFLCRTAISRKHQKECEHCTSPAMRFEQVSSMVALLLEIASWKLHGWSSENALIIFSEITHVDTLSRAEMLSQMSVSRTVPLREHSARAWADTTVKNAESATIKKSCLGPNIVSKRKNWGRWVH